MVTVFTCIWTEGVANRHFQAPAQQIPIIQREQSMTIQAIAEYELPQVHGVHPIGRGFYPERGPSDQAASRVLPFLSFFPVIYIE